MTVGTIVALILIVPIMLLPVALVWYINIGGIMHALADAKEKQVAGEKATVKA